MNSDSPERLALCEGSKLSWCKSNICSCKMTINMFVNERSQEYALYKDSLTQYQVTYKIWESHGDCRDHSLETSNTVTLVT